MEVRAFGFLLGELLQRKLEHLTEEETAHHRKQQELMEQGELKKADHVSTTAIHNVMNAANLCGGEPSARPSFANLVHILAN
jgi:hypothetical protein